ncbi:MAG: nicotinate phosphoribosyltransferase [Rhodoferax sp.]|nr:nicotinate phosphoribosyltransferase [Rhodoferax sp.]
MFEPSIAPDRAAGPAGELLLTDWYQLTMLQAYLAEGLTDIAVFEFFVRRLPAQRQFLLAAGLEQVLDYLEHLRLDDAEWAALQRSGRFDGAFLAALRGLRFAGDVDAMPEGTVFFAHEPILRVTAPLPQAQLVETRIINLLQFQTLVASKAARVRLAAPGRELVDFGLRRAHGAEAGLLGARASYLAGFDATSAVPAGLRWGIPLAGTMAHSYVQVHDSENAAFDAYARACPQAATLLIDTFDTEAAARRLVPLVHRLAADGIVVRAVRIDSGNLGELARRVRAILDQGGLQQVRIFASGSLDEHSVAGLVAGAAPIDGFGVGTRLCTSDDQPWLDCAYKLQAYGGRPKRKRSEGKATWPGAKQVYRSLDAAGQLAGDVLTTLQDPCPGRPLLQPVMRAGRRLMPSPDLEALRAHAAMELQRLPPAWRDLQPVARDPVRIAPALQRLCREVDALADAQPAPVSPPPPAPEQLQNE